MPTEHLLKELQRQLMEERDYNRQLLRQIHEHVVELKMLRTQVEELAALVPWKDV